MANSFVFSRQGRIKVNFGIFYQRLDALAQSGINTFQVFGMCSHVVSQEIQEFPQHRIIHGLAGYTRQHHTAVRLDEVANLVAFAQLECMSHRVWNRGLVAVGQCGFEFECVSHGVLLPAKYWAAMVMRMHCRVNKITHRCCEFLICPVVLLPKEGDMRPTKLLQEIRKMRFEEAYEGWNTG